MEHFKAIFITYVFLLLIALGFAFAVSLSFESITKYAFSVAIFIHSIAMLALFILIMNQDNSEVKEVANEIH